MAQGVGGPQNLLCAPSPGIEVGGAKAAAGPGRPLRLLPPRSLSCRQAELVSFAILHVREPFSERLGLNSRSYNQSMPVLEPS